MHETRERLIAFAKRAATVAIVGEHVDGPTVHVGKVLAITRTGNVVIAMAERQSYSVPLDAIVSVDEVGKEQSS